jgi:hypothetical protein
MHLTNVQKLFTLPSGAILGTAGDSDDREVRAVLARATPKRMPKCAKLAETCVMFEGLLVFPSSEVFFISILKRELEWTAGITPIEDEMIAIGSGSAYAYGAMEVGADPIRAVKAACKRDTQCALPVRSLRLP